jgi:hypothetical protein
MNIDHPGITWVCDERPEPEKMVVLEEGLSLFEVHIVDQTDCFVNELAERLPSFLRFFLTRNARRIAAKELLRVVAEMRPAFSGPPFQMPEAQVDRYLASHPTVVRRANR